MTKHWRGWGILDKHISTDISDWLIARRLYLFSFFFSNFRQNREPWYLKYMERLFKQYLFLAPRELSCEGRCWNAGGVVSVECVPELRLQPRGAPASVGPHLEERWAPSMLWSGYTLWTQKENESVCINLPVWTAFSYTGPIIGMEMSPTRLFCR